MAGTLTRIIWKKDRGDSLGKQTGGFAKRDPVAGTGGKLHLEAVSIEMVISLERLDDHEVDRHPDRSTPVRVAAKHAGLPLPRFVIHGVNLAVHRIGVGVLLMVFGDGADAMR